MFCCAENKPALYVLCDTANIFQMVFLKLKIKVNKFIIKMYLLLILILKISFDIYGFKSWQYSITHKVPACSPRNKTIRGSILVGQWHQDKANGILFSTISVIFLMSTHG